ncbi:hypothetical protein C9374_009013 [Naegleria lovaniensis]|uniref:t-SNARE coiled-coil homology domain-containing protein n=1 Tax=Naegleria lovaniensis TaxID=51637 RepID=A0AA88GG43_NAELO|nr:uncharacterized protein C9374_009013 [Naegleria lovaniensis]KAG2377928.1 hypothetical protein C9374_009013 [Naegleria lovaniensis]
MSSQDKLQTYSNELESVEGRIDESITTLRRLNITSQSDPNFIQKQIETQSQSIEEQLEKAKKLYNKINNLTKNDPTIENAVNETKKKHKEILSKLRSQFKQAKSFIETKAKGLTENLPNKSNSSSSSSTSGSNNAMDTSAPSTQTSFKESTKEGVMGFFGFGGNKNSTNNSETKQLLDNDEEDVVEVKVNETEYYKGNANLTKEQRQKHDDIERELFAEVFSTQKDCLDIIDRLNKKAEETIAIATDSAELLKQQREQLHRIDEEMDALGSNIKRAQKEVTSFMRRIHTDKCCAVMCLLVALAILGGCIFAIVMKFIPININNGGGNNNNHQRNSTSMGQKKQL